MSRAKAFAARRRGINPTLPGALLRDAGEMVISLSQGCEHGVAAEVVGANRRHWLEENRDAMDAWNGYIAEHGLPLGGFRQF